MRPLERLASVLNERPDELEREAAKALLLKKLKELDSDIASILVKYKASSAEELLEMIKSSKVKEHPAWEELIVLENLLEAKKRLLKLLEELEIQKL